MKRGARVLAVCVLALTTLAVGAAPASAGQGGETQCVGSLAPKVVMGDLVVPAGRNCFLFGHVVVGNVRINAGAGLSADRTEITGNIQAGQLARVGLFESRVGGTVTASSSRALQAFSSTLSGTVRAEDTERIDLDGATFGGDLEIIGKTIYPKILAFDVRVKGNLRTSNAEFSSFFGSRLDGDVTMERTRMEALLCESSVGGDATFVGNAAVTIGGELCGNEVRGDLAVHQNGDPTTNLEAITIANNVVRGDLACTGNTPPPTGGDNQVGGSKLGQCSGL